MEKRGKKEDVFESIFFCDFCDFFIRVVEVSVDSVPGRNF